MNDARKKHLELCSHQNKHDECMIDCSIHYNNALRQKVCELYIVPLHENYLASFCYNIHSHFIIT